MYADLTVAANVRAAKAVCSECPVKEACLEYALEMSTSAQIDFGIWGETTPSERRQISAKRDRYGR